MDDLHDWDAPPTLGDIAAALEIQLEKGYQYYAMPVGKTWLVFWNGKALIH